MHAFWLITQYIKTITSLFSLYIFTVPLSVLSEFGNIFCSHSKDYCIQADMPKIAQVLPSTVPNSFNFKVLSEKGAELSHAVRKAESYEREVSFFHYCHLYRLDDLCLYEREAIVFLYHLYHLDHSDLLNSTIFGMSSVSFMIFMLLMIRITILPFLLSIVLRMSFS